jgi:hypothetical protein
MPGKYITSDEEHSRQIPESVQHDPTRHTNTNNNAMSLENLFHRWLRMDREFEEEHLRHVPESFHHDPAERLNHNVEYYIAHGISSDDITQSIEILSRFP